LFQDGFLRRTDSLGKRQIHNQNGPPWSPIVAAIFDSKPGQSGKKKIGRAYPEIL
jgi:hypothetical protein